MHTWTASSASLQSFSEFGFHGTHCSVFAGGFTPDATLFARRAACVRISVSVMYEDGTAGHAVTMYYTIFNFTN